MMRPDRLQPSGCDVVRLEGHLGLATRLSREARGKVVVSALSSGECESMTRNSLRLAYVAEGTELYRYHGRSYPVTAGTFLLVPERVGGHVAIDKRAGTARGMCVLLPEPGEWPSAQPCGSPGLEEPIVFSARSSSLGVALASFHQRAAGQDKRTPDDGVDIGTQAGSLLALIERQIEPFVVDALRSIDSIEAVKASTRYENFRRLEVSRTYLHSIDDRRVDLPELARVANLSRFHLTRLFADQFGLPPSAYHRRLRLELAREQLRSGRMNCAEAAHRYGFGDPAHFSRIFRQAYGRPPSDIMDPRW